MKKKPFPSTPVSELIRHFENLETSNQRTSNQRVSNPEPIYAKVNKQPKEPPKKQEETVYAPQNPAETAHGAVGGEAHGGRSPQRLVSPYMVTDLQDLERGQDSQQWENPLYEPMGAVGGQSPQDPETHLYEEIGEEAQRERASQDPIDPYTITYQQDLGESQDSQQWENPLYEPMGAVGGQSPQGSKTYIHEATSEGAHERRTPSDPLDPYAVTYQQDLGESQDSQQWENPLYEPMGAVGGQSPQDPETHLYEEIGEEAQRRRSSRPPEETVYAPQIPPETAPGLVPPYRVSNPLGRDPNFQPQNSSLEQAMGEGAVGGHDPQRLDNPLYEGAGTDRPPLPPRTPQDQIKIKMAEDQDLQHGVLKIQKLCQTVYGNKFALGEHLSKVLNDPENAEEALWELLENPKGPGRLAGQKFLGIKSPDRKEAEKAFGSLCEALEEHIVKAQKLHKNLTREQERGRRYERGEHQEEQEHSHRHHHRRRHHDHSQERGQESPERQRRGRQSPEHSKEGMAFAM
ncbi:BID domain-containing T4SS effector [Bartonella sp. ML70XJBT.G]|uniref:BID domain-containing T4SS effector n=1 Tax=Bartonella sp. ML70XJBT.G TaxID=3019093 RepID=UPI002361C4CC|nr:BID domain-containing T4SS effector [Bartonella sp. ML70XJBT.G]